MKETKTRRAHNVGLLAPLADDLAARHAITAHDAPTDLVFPKAGGTPWSDYGWRNWPKRVFRPAAQIAGVAGIRPYDLRHLFVSLVISEGRSIVDVAAQAGHAPSLSLRHLRPRPVRPRPHGKPRA